MSNFRRIAALLCAVSIMAMAAGCGAKNSANSADSADGTTAASPAKENDAPAEEETEAETEADADSDADSSADSSSNATLDSVGTSGSMTYSYSSEWTASDAGGQITYTLPDNSGALLIQMTDGASFSSLETEDEMIEMLAEQSESAWKGLEGMEILDSSWKNDLIDGKKCYVVSYSYVISSITTTNTSYFFANFTDSSKELFAITGSALTEDSEIGELTEEVLASVSFDAE